MKNIIVFICIISLAFLNVEGGVTKCLQHTRFRNMTSNILSLTSNDCPVAHSNGCAASFYKYNSTSFSYGGPAMVQPEIGEVGFYMTDDPNGINDLVFIGRPNGNDISWSVEVKVMGFIRPVSLLLMDDPSPLDTTDWVQPAFTGTFNFSTSRSYTDGFVLGHFDFNAINGDACVSMTIRSKEFNAFNKISLLNGTTSSVDRLSLGYWPGNTHSFCLQPRFNLRTVCGNASLSDVSGIPNYRYYWYHNNGTQIGYEPKISGLKRGTYKVAVSDRHGCRSERTFYIVQNTILPVLTVPANTTVECGQSSHPDATGWATATSECDGQISIKYRDVDLDGYCGRGYSVRKVIARTWTATDMWSNSVSSVQYIEVVRRAPPCLIAPSNTTRKCSLFNPLDVSLGVANVLDLCVEVNLCKPDIHVELREELTLGVCTALLSTKVVLRHWVAVDVCNLLELHAWQKIDVALDLLPGL